MTTVQRTPFAALLRRHRRAAGLTQEELAERASLSVNAISALERGVNQSPHRETVVLLADALTLTEVDRAAFEAASRNRAAVGGLDASPAAAPARLSPFVGRAREMAQIELHLAPEVGPTPLLLLTGEPGIGKSRVLYEAARLARADGWMVLAGGCHRRGGQEPYEPLLGALASFIHSRPHAALRTAFEDCSWLVRLLPELAEAALLAPPPWALPPAQERRLMFVAVRRFLENLAADAAGVLLILDDLQWAGADALDLLGSLARSTAPSRPRILGAYRRTEASGDGPLSELLADLAREGLAAQIELGRLDPGEATNLLRQMATAGEMGGAVEHALRLAEGVPFYLVSYAQALAQNTPSARTSGGDPESESASTLVSASPAGQKVAGIPWEVAQSIRARVSALPPGARDLLGVAAVAGREVSRAVLLAAAATDDQDEAHLLAALEAACRAELLEEAGDEVYAFSHDLIREVALTDLGAARRALLHGRAAEALERAPGEQPVERLAFHYARAGRHEKAIAYIERAGDKAAAVQAYAAAEGHYRELMRALENRGQAANLAPAREKLGSVLRLRGQLDEASDLLEQALLAYRLASDLDGLARVAAHIGWLHVSKRTPAVGLARLEPLLALFATDEHARGQVLLNSAIADLYYITGRYADQLRAAERAVDLARSASDEWLVGLAEQVRGRALLMLGRLDTSSRAVTEAAELSEATGDLASSAFALTSAALLARVQGSLAEDQRYTARAYEVAKRLGEPILLALTACNRGMSAFYRGDWAAAREDIAAAQASLGTLDLTWVAPYILFAAGQLDIAIGRAAEGERRLREALLLAERIGDLMAIRFAQRTLAECDLLAGRPAAARDRLLPLLDRDGQRETFAAPLLPTLAWAEIESRDGEQAAARIAEAIVRARSERLHLALADALRVQSLLLAREGDQRAAQDAANESLVVTHAMGFPWGEAQALFALGLASTAAQEIAAARDAFQRALAICDRLGERFYHPHISRALAALPSA